MGGVFLFRAAVRKGLTDGNQEVRTRVKGGVASR